MISFQTNIPSLTSQNNLRINNEFQGRTITRLTSGYRINSSGDDAAGLAIANSYRTFVSEVTQGIRNANDGLSTLQIVDGGLGNITRILDRLKSLATQSASGTFQGDRGTLNDEYQALLNEIDAQANKVGLGSGAYGGRFNTDISVYVGGAGTDTANAKVAIDLSGTANRIDAASLGLAGTSVDGGGITNFFAADLAANPLTADIADYVDLRAGKFLDGSNTQDFVFNITDQSGINVDVTVTVNGLTADGITGAEAVEQLNTSLRAYGIQTSINTENGLLQFSGAVGFSVTANSATGTGKNLVRVDDSQVSALNQGMYEVTGDTFVTLDATLTTTNQVEELTFFVGNESRTVTLDPAAFNGGVDGDITIREAMGLLNSKLNEIGIYAVEDSGKISFQSLRSFEYSVTSDTGVADGVFTSDVVRAAAASPIDEGGIAASAESAIAAIDSAVVSIGLVQGKVGSSQNRLNYAIDLAESQISSYSAAEARIRDADIAAEAANLTKAQVMQQASIAALAQANAVPQALLALLRG